MSVRYSTYISKYNAVIVDNTVNDKDIEKALLHELGHKIKHNQSNILYNCAPSYRLKMEHEANEFMIDELVSDYLANNDVDPKNVNYANFANNNKLSDTSTVKKALNKCLKASIN